MTTRNELAASADSDAFLTMLSDAGVSLSVKQHMAYQKALSGDPFDIRLASTLAAMGAHGFFDASYNLLPNRFSDAAALDVVIADTKTQIAKSEATVAAAKAKSNAGQPKAVVDLPSGKAPGSSTKKSAKTDVPTDPPKAAPRATVAPLVSGTGGEEVAESPDTSSNDFHANVRRILGGGVIAKLVDDMAGNFLYDQVFDRERQRVPGPTLTGDAVHEAGGAAGRVVGGVGRGIKRILKWVGIAALILLLGMVALTITFGQTGLFISIGIIALLVYCGVWMKRNFDEIPVERHNEWVRNVGNEIPVVLRMTGFSYNQLANPTQPEVFNAVLQQLQANVDSRFNASKEAKVDNLLREMIARIYQYYTSHGYDPNKVCDSPAFVSFPRDLYEMELAGNPDIESNPKSSRKGFWDNDW